MEEYQAVLHRKKFHFTDDYIDLFLNMIMNHSIYQLPIETLEIPSNPKDVIFYQIVMSSRSKRDTYLVTGNLKDFPIQSFVVTPREMLDIIELKRDNKIHEDPFTYNTEGEYMKTVIIEMKIDHELKEKAAIIFKRNGMDFSDSIWMFLKMSILKNGIPFEMKLDKSKS